MFRERVEWTVNSKSCMHVWHFYICFHNQVGKQTVCLSVCLTPMLHLSLLTFSWHPIYWHFLPHCCLATPAVCLFQTRSRSLLCVCECVSVHLCESYINAPPLLASNPDLSTPLGIESSLYLTPDHPITGTEVQALLWGSWLHIRLWSPPLQRDV